MAAPHILPKDPFAIADRFEESEDAVLYPGSCNDFLATIPKGRLNLIVTSPPYNLGKEYERRLSLATYLEQQEEVIKRCIEALAPSGNLCWQVGNYVDDGEIVPLDTILYPLFIKHGLALRNRIVWHFEHGLHCSRRFSGRYETILWFTRKGEYHFDLDPVRVPQKYPGKKHFKGPKAGQYSGNPLGKNPGDVWIIPNVKSNHVEKTEHPCQFPVELVERLVLSLTSPGDWVFDPFLGSGTSIIAALRNGRRGCGAEVSAKYVKIAAERIRLQRQGLLKTRPMHKPVYDPAVAGNSLTISPFTAAEDAHQYKLLERQSAYDDQE